MRRALSLSLLLLLLLVGSPGAAEEEPSMLARSSNRFGLELYGRLRASPGNLAFSPASITTALTMTWGGARGETAAQMARTLHLGGSAAELMTAAGKLAATLEAPGRSLTLRIANRLFGEKSYRFEDAYLRAVRAAYGAALDSLDFRHEAERARAHINAWVEEKTEKRIRDLLPPRSVDSETRLVLVNAIYFLADWADPFEKRRTIDAPFHVTRRTTKQVPTMHRALSVRVGEDGDVRALELPYEGGQASMLIVLPRAVDGLAAVEKSLDASRLDAIVASLGPARVLVALPKFELRPAEPLSLATDLRALGMTDAFDRRRADFTGMANPASPAERLFISKVFHKAFVKVDEKGTEAAAATAVVMTRAGSAPQQLEELRVDHPFLFFIRDHATGLVLFMGRVVDPS